MYCFSTEGLTARFATEPARSSGLVLRYAGPAAGGREEYRFHHPGGAMSQCKGVREVGYFGCAGGGQVMVDGHYAYIGHISAPHGTTVVDVSDPRNPRRLAELSIEPGLHPHKAPAANGIMLINYE